jgi:glycerol-3-phosphate dehydrogenase
VLYHDGQFDDTRLAINLAQTAAENGAAILNYCKVQSLIKTETQITGVRAHDFLNNKDYEIKSKVVINATGVFTDGILKMNDEHAEDIIAASRGVHIVLDKEFLPGDAAIMVPHTDDNRVLFAVPWHNKIIIGTTDTPVNEHNEQSLAEPKASDEEIDFILQQIGKYLTHTPHRKNIKSVFAGLRPLVKGNSKKTAELSRDHLIAVSESGLITITGGKWTTYRRMAEDAINVAIKKASLEHKPCITDNLKIHGAKQDADFKKPFYYYGTDEDKIKLLIEKNKSLAEVIHPNLPYLKAQIIWAVQNEMCMTVEDALARRTRALLLDAKAAIESATVVASLMAAEMNKDERWMQEQVALFGETAKNYLPNYIS